MENPTQTTLHPNDSTTILTKKHPLINHKFPVLDDGFVTLIDYMGDDEAVEKAARTSYGEGTRTIHEIEGLIRYLMRHRHTTPFEMAEVKLLVRVPMDCWRQWIRHRTANVNEYSTRFSIAIDAAQKTGVDEWRTQGKKNKQGSGDGEIKWPEGYEVVCDDEGTCDEVRIWDKESDSYCDVQAGGPNPRPGDYLTFRESEFQRDARDLYEERIKFGVAREQARKDLPLSTYTEAYWKCDLHNIFNFLSLRMEGHAQKEIRDYANVIGEKIIASLFPICWKAFEDFRLNSVALSWPEIGAIHRLSQMKDFRSGVVDAIAKQVFPNRVNPEKKSSEHEEFVEKLKSLHLYEMNGSSG